MKEVDPAMQPARLVVLASGMGSRLRSKTRPKPLVVLGGISLVERAVVGASHAQGLNITIQSYLDSLDFGLAACRELVPDLWDLVDAIVDDLGELAKAAGVDLAG